MIHFDAHADLRQDYLGAELSHACVLRRCWELLGDGRIFQFGIRSGDREEFAWGKEHVTTRKFDFQGLKECLETLNGRPVYFTLTWMCWILPYFREPVRRKREALRLIS